MAEDPFDEEDPQDAESRFLIALWNELDPVDDLSTVPQAIQNLPAIEACLAAALSLVRRWQTGERIF